MWRWPPPPRRKCRFRRDLDVVDKAAEIVRNPLGGQRLNLTFEQARDVVRRELASPGFPNYQNPAPDYGDLLPSRKTLCASVRTAAGSAERLLRTWHDEEEDNKPNSMGLRWKKSLKRYSGKISQGGCRPLLQTSYSKS